MSVKTFKGYRGVATHLDINGLQFFVVANSPLALRQLYDYILPEPEEPFSTDHCQKVIVIAADELPEPKQSKLKSGILKQEVLGSQKSTEKGQ